MFISLLPLKIYSSWNFYLCSWVLERRLRAGLYYIWGKTCEASRWFLLLSVLCWSICMGLKHPTSGASNFTLKAVFISSNSGFQVKVRFLTGPDYWVLCYKSLCALGWGCEPPGWAPASSLHASLPLCLDFQWNLTHKHSQTLVSSRHSRHFLCLAAPCARHSYETNAGRSSVCVCNEHHSAVKWMKYRHWQQWWTQIWLYEVRKPGKDKDHTHLQADPRN